MVKDSRQRAVLLHLPRNPPIDIEFHDITYTVGLGIGRGKRQIINGVSGRFKSGELTAIMGPSGAGKSSLLNILTGFHKSGMGGEIKINNVRSTESSAKLFKKESCYILQDDQLTPFFTAEESMQMAANLKLGTSVSQKAKQLIIDDILDTLSLLACRKTRCDQLSGGQKKRLSIALELVDNPPIMFLDEPTTGLDSSSSLQCVAMLKALARGGRTIICTIHQPSASIYEQFDQVYVMNQGYCVYQGTSLNTVPYLQSYGFNCPKYHNPADYLLEITNGDYGDFLDMMVKGANTKEWLKNKSSVMMNQKPELITRLSTRCSLFDTSNENKSMILISPPSEFSQFLVLYFRSLLHLYRDWTVTQLKLCMHLFVGVFIGLFYLRFGNDGSKTFSNVGFLIVSLVYLSYTSMMPAVLKFPLELPILRKERFNNWYKLKTYYIAFMVADIPVQLIFTAVYVSVAYYMSAQPLEWERFGMFLGMCMLITLTSQSFGLFLGTTVNPVNGTFFGAIFTAIMVLFAGFLVLFSHMPRVMYWVSYLTYLRYAYEGLVLAIYGYNRTDLICPDEVTYCHYRYPSVMLRDMSMDTDRYWFNFSILCVNLLLLRIVAYFTLRRKLCSL